MPFLSLSRSVGSPPALYSDSIDATAATAALLLPLRLFASPALTRWVPAVLEATWMPLLMAAADRQGMPASLSCGRHASLGELRKGPERGGILQNLNHADSPLIREAQKTGSGSACSVLVSSHQNCAGVGLGDDYIPTVIFIHLWCQVCWNSVSTEAWNGIVRLLMIQQPS
jgi:hypothetical protein